MSEIIIEFLKNNKKVKHFVIHDEREFAITVSYDWAKTVVEEPWEDEETIAETVLMELYLKIFEENLGLNLNHYYCHVEYN